MADITDKFLIAADYDIRHGVRTGLMAIWLATLTSLTFWNETGEHLQVAVNNQRAITTEINEAKQAAFKEVDDKIAAQKAAEEAKAKAKAAAEDLDDDDDEPDAPELT